MSNEIFEKRNDQEADGNQTSFLDQLVGEGKKFNDTESLARGKAEGDRYIEELKQELATERAKNQSSQETNQKLEELMERLSNSTNNKNTPLDNNSDNRQAVEDTKSTNAVSLDDLNVEEKVLEVLKQKEAEQAASVNVSKVRDELVRVYGEKAQEVLEGKASQLGMTMEQVNNLAASSPVALIELILPKDAAKESFNKVSVNSDALEINSKDPNAKGWSHYRELKRKNPGLFWKSWGEMNKQIEAMGTENFYNS